MNPNGPSAGFDWSVVFDTVFETAEPLLPSIALVAAAVIFVVLMRMPLPGRGPGLGTRRDPWRGFRFQARRTVLSLAGHRCEGSQFLVWARCRQPAQEVDHIYPWSKRGGTIVSNGQALCTRHNRSKSNTTPAWWYVLSLERRRRKYYPSGSSIRVRAALGPADRAARAAWIARKHAR